MKDYVPALWDTAPDAQVSVSLDIGIIPRDFEHGGQYVVTLQALPFAKLVDAQRIADAIREAVGSRLGVRFPKTPVNVA